MLVKCSVFKVTEKSHYSSAWKMENMAQYTHEIYTNNNKKNMRCYKTSIAELTPEYVAKSYDTFRIFHE